MKDLANPVISQWVADMKAKGFDGDQLLADARGLIAKHSKK